MAHSLGAAEIKALILTALTTLAGLGMLLLLGTLVGRTLALLINRRGS